MHVETHNITYNNMVMFLAFSEVICLMGSRTSLLVILAVHEMCNSLLQHHNFDWLHWFICLLDRPSLAAIGCYREDDHFWYPNFFRWYFWYGTVCRKHPLIDSCWTSVTIVGPYGISWHIAWYYLGTNWSITVILWYIMVCTIDYMVTFLMT